MKKIIELLTKMRNNFCRTTERDKRIKYYGFDPFDSNKLIERKH